MPRSDAVRGAARPRVAERLHKVGLLGVVNKVSGGNGRSVGTDDAHEGDATGAGEILCRLIANPTHPRMTNKAISAMRIGRASVR